MAQVTQEYVLRVTAEGLQAVVQEIKALRADMNAVGGAATGASGALGKAGTAADKWNTKAKGVAGATNNSTKAFSKMSESVTGVLVPAYATVAANVFALTAAFGALERAMDTQILIKASDQLATQTGRNLTLLARNLKEITDGALSMKEGLTQASIAASAGFDNTTIERLGQVARNASIALGRDLTDSMNRVFKGAIKAEPELLDELGIILRLQPAVQKYAAALGKSVTELTTFERQQAVVNEVLAQGEDKFSQFGTVDVNPYTKLAAAFSDTANSLLSLINVPVAPFFEFFATNSAAMTSALLLFANTVLKRAIPAIANLGTAFKEKLAAQMEASIASFKQAVIAQDVFSAIKSTGAFRGGKNEVLSSLLTYNKNEIAEYAATLKKHGDDFQYLYEGILAPKGKLTVKGLKDVISSATSELALMKKNFSGTAAEAKLYEEALNGVIGTAQGSLKAIESYNNGLIKSATLYQRAATGTKIFIDTLGAGVSLIKSAGISAFAAGLEGGLKTLNVSLDELKVSLENVSTVSKGTSKAITGLATASVYLGAAIGSAIKYISSAVVWIGFAVIAYQTLSEAIGWVLDKFRDTKAIEETNKALESQVGALDNAVKAVKTYNKEYKNAPKTIDNLTKSTELQKNVLLELNDANKELLANTKGFGEIFGSNIEELTVNLNNEIDVLKSLGYGKEAADILKEFGDGNKIVADRALEAARSISRLTDNVFGLQNALYEANKSLSDSVDNLGQVYDKLSQSTGKLTPLQEAFLALSVVLDKLSTSDIITQLDIITNLPTNIQVGGGITKQVEQVTALKNAYLSLGDVYKQDLEKRNEYNSKILSLQEKLSNAVHIKGKAGVPADLGTKAEISDLYNLAVGVVKELNSIETTQAAITASAKNYVKEIIKGIDSYISKLKDAFDAQRRLNAETKKLEFQKTLPGLTGSNIDVINKKIIENRKATVSQTLKDARVLNGITKSSVKDLIDEYERFKVLYAKDLANPTAENFNVYKERLVYQERIRDAKRDELTLSNVLADAELELASIDRDRLSQLLSRYSELAKIEKETGKVSLLGDNTSSVLNEMESLLKEMGISFDYLNSGATEYTSILDAAVKQQAYLSALEDAGNIKNAAAMKQELRDIERNNESYAKRLAYEEDHGYLISEAINAQSILNGLQLEQNQRILENLQRTAILTANWDQLRQVNAQLENNQLLINENLKDQTKELEEAHRLTLANLDLDIKKARIEQNYSNVRLKDINVTYQLAKRISELKPGEIFNQEDIDRITKLTKLKAIETIKEQIQETRDSVSDLGKTFDELGEKMAAAWDQLSPNEKLAAAFSNATKLAENFHDSQITGFAQAAEALIKFKEDFKAFKPLSESVADAMIGVGGALKTAFQEGSQAAKSAALIEGIGAVIKAWNAPPGYPWNLPMVAVAAANVAKLLSQIGENANVNPQGGAQKAEAIQKSFADTGVQNLKLQNNSFASGNIDKLIDVNTRLFSEERKLILAIKDLSETFKKVGASLYNFAGSFSEVDITKLFGTKFGTSINTGFFGSTTTTKSLLAAGVEFGASISFVADKITGGINDARAFIIKQVEKSGDPGIFGIGGSDASTKIKTQFSTLGQSVIDDIQTAFEGTTEYLTQLFRKLSSVTNVSLETLFSKASNIVIDATKLNLKDKSAQEQADTIAAFFTDMSDQVIKEVLPGLSKFSKAGEQLTDTLSRIIEQTITLDNMFMEIGTTLDNISFGNFDISAEFNKYIGTFSDVVNSQISTVQAELDRLTELSSTKLGKSARKEAAAQIAEQYPGVVINYKNFYAEIDKIRTNLQDKIDTLAKSIGVTIGDFAIEASTTWNEEFLKNFTGIDEVKTMWDKFTKSIYSETELADIALQNSKNVLAQGLVDITDLLDSMGRSDLASTLGTEITQTSLRAFYEAGTAADLFSVKFDEATGTFDTSGADLLARVIQLGSAFIDVQDAADAADTALSDFEQNIRRQIESFGLLGKELDILQLSFDFEDAIKEAQKVGADITQVELLFGLKRLAITKQYYEETANIIKDSMSQVHDAVLNAARAFDNWDEVTYQALKIDNLRQRLQKGLKQVGINIDFSSFDNILSGVGDINTFLNSFGSILDFSQEIPGTVQDQITLLNDLKSAIVDRYAAEAQALKQLKNDIKNFLDDILLSNLSPLTNLQKFNEAQSRFTRNINNLLSGNADLAEAARGDLISSANNLLDQARQYFAIGGRYQDVFNSVTGQLSAIDSTLLNDIATPQDTKLLMDQLDTLDDILTQLELQNQESLNTEIASLADMLNPNITAITEKLDELKDSTWIPIRDALLNIPSLDTGSNYIPFDQLAFVHKGEQVIPAEYTGYTPSNGVTNNVNNISNIINNAGSTFNNEEIVNAIRVLTQVLAVSQEDILEETEKQTRITANVASSMTNLKVAGTKGIV